MADMIRKKIRPGKIICWIKGTSKNQIWNFVNIFWKKIKIYRSPFEKKKYEIKSPQPKHNVNVWTTPNTLRDYRITIVEISTAIHIVSSDSHTLDHKTHSYRSAHCACWASLPHCGFAETISFHFFFLKWRVRPTEFFFPHEE